MKSLKRFVSGIVAAGIMTTGSMTFAYNPFERLEKYGIMKQGEEVATYMTREEVAKIIAPSFAKDPTEGIEADLFTDIKAGHPSIGYIDIAKDKGIIKGFPDGSFRPEENITYAQAIKIIVCMLGYEQMADSMSRFNPYPANYLSIGESLGLMDKVDLGADAFVTQEQMATLVDFALDLPIMERIEIEDSVVFKINEDTSLFKKYLKS